MEELYNYENFLDKETRKKQGIVYTPKLIVDYINKKCLSLYLDDIVPPKVIDFSCGTGVFLVDMANKISARFKMPIEEVYDKCIFANDIDINATALFASITGCKNVTNLNGLSVDLTSYDIIVGNPPYVKIQNLDNKTKKEVQMLEWCEDGNTDLFLAFSEKKAKSNKIYGMICPNSWIKSKAGSKMRRYLIKKNINELIDFRDKQIFKEMAYTSIVISSGKEEKNLLFKTSLEEEGQMRSYEELAEDNFFLYKKEAEILDLISKKQNRFLDYFNINVGLATLYDKGYYLKAAKEKDGLIVVDGFYLEKDLVKKAFKASRIKTSKQNDYFIFPYKNGKIIKEKVLKTKYPLTFKYLNRFKDKFLDREKGEFRKKYDNGKVEWYEYGRSQALSVQDEKILIPPIFKEFNYVKINEGLFFSGYCIYPKNNKYDFDDLIEILDSQEMREWIKINANHKAGGYYSVSKSTFENFRF